MPKSPRDRVPPLARKRPVSTLSSTASTPAAPSFPVRCTRISKPSPSNTRTSCTLRPPSSATSSIHSSTPIGAAAASCAPRRAPSAPRRAHISPGPDADTTQAAAGPDSLTKIFRQLNAMERSYLRALTELRRVKEERNQPQPEQQPEPKPNRAAPGGISPSKPPQTGGIGFVPPIPGFSIQSYGPSPAPISSTFGRLPNGEPIAVRGR